MTILEFYKTYVLTRKAYLMDYHGTVIKPVTRKQFLHLEFDPQIGRAPMNINHDQSIQMLSRVGIQIVLITDPIYLTASTLTGVISIPVPEPDELPF